MCDSNKFNLTHRNISSGLCVYVCVLVLCLLLFPSKQGRVWTLSSEYNIDQVVLTDWISFLPSNLRVEINPNPEALSAKPKTFNQHEIAEKANDHLGIKALI